MTTVAFTINGKPASVEADGDTPLLWIVREHLKLIGTKFGCGAGLCGACTVHVDGKAVRSCQTQVSDVANKKVTTIEGLSPGFEPSAAKGLGRDAGAAMRLLPVRPDHAGRRIAGEKSEANPRADRLPHGRQYLPLRYLRVDHRRHSERRLEREGIMLQDTNTLALSRRSFLVSTGAFSVAVAFGSALDTATAAAPFDPNAWVTISEDNIITIVAPMVEMGQGVRTSLPLILAEDLDADWSRVRISETPDNDKVYGNPIFNSQLTTVGSFSVTGYYEKLRLAGAQARKILIANAAAAWNVPADELTTEPSMVVHKKSNRKISYGDIAKTATVPNPLPEVTKADLKPASQFRFIGRDIGRVDVPSKVNGTAQYGIDVQLPGMLYASVLFPQVQYEKAEQIDDAAAKAIKGVVKIVPLPSGVGVIAETPQAAMKAKGLLKVTWSKSTPAQTYDDDRVLQDYRAIAADWSQPGVPMVNAGDADAAIKGAAQVLTADYFSDHVAHMCMEPLNVTVRADNGVIDIWSGNQSPSTMKILGMIVGKTTPDKVHVHTQLLGGGFGRRSDGDDMVMALILALNMPGKPVKMIWSREDDIRNDKLRPLTAQRIEIGLDGNNDIVGWRQRIVNEFVFGAHLAA